jgi:hypothetical protein
VKAPIGTKGFDMDLQHGEMGEALLADLLTGCKVEVKRDRQAWRTGNVAVEFRCRGAWSGISTTKADWWAFLLDNEAGAVVNVVFIRTADLRAVFKRHYCSWVPPTRGGDDNQSEMVLIPVRELLQEWGTK